MAARAAKSSNSGGHRSVRCVGAGFLRIGTGIFCFASITRFAINLFRVEMLLFFVAWGLLPNFGLTPEKCGKETFSIELN